MRLPVAFLLLAFAAQAETTLTLAALRLMPEAWNKEANFRKLERYTREAASEGAQLVITPEGFLEGYVANIKRQRDLTREKYFTVGESIDGLLMNRVRSLARELKIYLSVGYAEKRGDRMYNSVAMFSPDGAIAHRYSKTHTADDEPFNTKGTEFPVSSLPFGKLGTLICYDRQLPETARLLAVKGTELLLVPSWGTFGEMNTVMMRTRAYENSVWLAFVHPQRVLIIDPRGTIVAEDAPYSGDQIVRATIRIDPSERKGPIRHRTPDIYR